MQVATVGNNAHSCDGGIITDVKGTMSECEPRLPSYEEAVAMPDCAKLPSYSVKFSARFHPYKRPMLKTAQEVDRLFVSFFDFVILFATYLFFYNKPFQNILEHDVRRRICPTGRPTSPPQIYS